MPQSKQLLLPSVYLQIPHGTGQILTFSDQLIFLLSFLLCCYWLLLQQYKQRLYWPYCAAAAVNRTGRHLFLGTWPVGKEKSAYSSLVLFAAASVLPCPDSPSTALMLAVGVQAAAIWPAALQLRHLTSLATEQ